MVNRTKVDIDDFLFLVSWVFAPTLTENRSFKYQNLLDQAITNQLKNIPLDVTIHKIDDFMVDVYIMYDKIISIEDNLSEAYDAFNSLVSGGGLFGGLFGDLLGGGGADKITKEMLIENVNRYKKVFSDMMIYYEYEKTEIRGIQKNFLKAKLQELVDNEDYELAADVRDKIKNI